MEVLENTLSNSRNRSCQAGHERSRPIAAPLAQGGQIGDQGYVGAANILGDLVGHGAVERADFHGRVRRALNAFIQGLDDHLLDGSGDLVALGPAGAHAKNVIDFLSHILGVDVKIFAHVPPQCSSIWLRKS